MRTYIVRVKLEQEEDGRWSALAPDLPGCATWGSSEQEALTNIQEAASGYIESLIDRGLPIPTAIGQTDNTAIAVNVSAA